VRDPDPLPRTRTWPGPLSGWKLLALLIVITAVGPLSLTILMPALPGIVRALNSDVQTIQLMLSLYLVAMAFSQLLLGAISDRLGRRPVLIGGLLLAVLASIAAALAPTTELLIVARVVQAFGASTGIVISRAIIRDSYDRTRSAVMLSWVTMAMVVVPMVAPSIGGLLMTLFGWPAIFLCIAAGAGIVLVLVVLRLPETLAAPVAGAGVTTTLNDVRALLKTRAFLGYVLTCAFGSALFFGFLGGAPHVVINTMQRSSVELGLWFALGGLGYMSGNFTTARFAGTIGIDRMIRAGVLIGLAGSAAMVLCAWAIPHWGPATLFIPYLVTAFANGLLIPNCIAGAISVRPEAAGTASGITGFSQMFVGAAGAQIVSLFLALSETGLPMTVVLLLFGLASTAFCFTLMPLKPRGD
jgi:MFS transporter, DHA1 family, multidrug resistance protein